LVGLGAACGSTNTTPTGTGLGSGAGPTTTTSVGAGASTGSTCPGDLAEAPNSAFCAKDGVPVDCTVVPTSDKTQVCGVALPSPTTTLTRSANVMEFAGSGPPELSCFLPANYPTAGTPQMVTVSGLAKIFAHGCASTGLDIEIHKVTRTSDSHNGEMGALVGKAITTPMDCSTPATGMSVPDPSMNCSEIYECVFTYPDVPTETELVILTKGNEWAPLYEYNDYIPNSQVKAGVWTHNVRALATDDYSAIAQAALGQPITPGNGAVAGEAHDCGDVRLIGATVDVNVERKLLTYFTTNEANPLPDTSATATTALGLYAALDVSPGPVSVGALGLVDGKITTVGWYQVQVYPDSVTAVTFQGPRPFQIK
jgi:hypothetical protein